MGCEDTEIDEVVRDGGILSLAMDCVARISVVPTRRLRQMWKGPSVSGNGSLLTVVQLSWRIDDECWVGDESSSVISLTRRDANASYRICPMAVCCLWNLRL